MKTKKRTLIACSMLEDEITHILETYNIKLPVIWLDRGLHNSPQKLNQKLQAQIDQLQDQDEILLTFGLCGNGTAGLISPGTILRMPKFDDCINMLVCNQPRTARKQTKTDALYLTRGWTLDDASLLQQYQTLSETYDPKMRDFILKTMFSGYHTLSVIDTGCYDLSSVEAYSREAAACLHLESDTVSGNLSTLEHLLTGTADSNILTLAPGEPVIQSLFEL